MTPDAKRARSASEAVHRRKTCRACEGTHFELVLDLGEVPLANSYLSETTLAQPEPRFPLEVYFCTDCSLLQLLHVVDPRVLFAHYLYQSGTSNTLAKHNEGISLTVSRELGLQSTDLVVEIASNDGSLLRWFQELGVRTLGVEPAKNIAAIARDAGIETLNEFFNTETAARIVRDYGQARVIVANNVLAHVDATSDFLRAAKQILRADGRLVIEVPYLAEMLERLEYDTVYHEHLCYFAVTPIMRLFESAGLALDRVDRVPIHGGSLRLWGKHRDSSGHSETVRELAVKEEAAGFTRLETYREYERRVKENRTKLLDLLGRLKREGRRVVGYGAPAKGNTLLCYCGIGTELLPYTIDRSPLKIGLYTPGSRLPIRPFEHILEDKPDYVLILAWNFADEIIQSLQSLKARGTRFILPIPDPTIL